MTATPIVGSNHQACGNVTALQQRSYFTPQAPSQAAGNQPRRSSSGELPLPDR
jgi:hypothetical protein